MLHPVLRKTFGGLTRQYYIRQFLFGLIFPAIYVAMMLNNPQHDFGAGTVFVLIVNSLLYPYARFVYESVIGYIVGDNLFILNALVMLLFKFIMMAVCWMLAIFIAPIGLLYLYIHHSRRPTA